MNIFSYSIHLFFIKLCYAALKNTEIKRLYHENQTFFDRLDDGAIAAPIGGEQPDPRLE